MFQQCFLHLARIRKIQHSEVESQLCMIQIQIESVWNDSKFGLSTDIHSIGGQTKDMLGNFRLRALKSQDCSLAKHNALASIQYGRESNIIPGCKRYINNVWPRLSNVETSKLVLLSNP